MHYDELGEANKPVVLFLPGANCPYTFSNQYHFADRYHLVIPHLPGNGLESNTPYTLRECVDGIVKIAEQFAGQPIYLVGFSLGAQLVIPVLCKAPQLFKKAMLISPWVLKTGVDLRAMALFMVFLLPLDKWAPLVRWQARKIRLTPEQSENAVAFGRLLKRETMKRYVLDSVDIDDYPDFSKLTLSMLVLCGSKENKALMRASVERLASMNNHCSALVLEGHAHDIPYKHPEELDRILSEFLC